MKIPFIVKLNQKYIIDKDIKKLVLVLYKYDREGSFFYIVKEHYKEFPKSVQEIINPQRLQYLDLECGFEEILNILEHDLGGNFSRYKDYAIRKYKGDVKSLDNIEIVINGVTFRSVNSDKTFSEILKGLKTDGLVIKDTIFDSSEHIKLQEQ